MEEAATTLAAFRDAIQIVKSCEGDHECVLDALNLVGRIPDDACTHAEVVSSESSPVLALYASKIRQELIPYIGWFADASQIVFQGKDAPTTSHILTADENSD